METYLNLSTLLDPLPVDKFFEEHLDEAPAFVGGGPEKIANLFNWTDVNEWLNNSKIWSSETLKLFNKGLLIPASDYCFNGLNRDLKPILRPDPTIVSEYLANGAYLELNNFGGADPILLKLMQALSSAFGSRAEARLRCSGPHETKEVADFDSADAFHLQLDGSSYWALFGERATVSGEVQPEQVVGELEMAAGDMLYIPSGQFYRYAGLSKECLSLTVLLPRPNGAALITLIKEFLTDSALFRADLPSFDEEVSSKAHFGKLARAASKMLTGDEFLKSVCNFQRSQMSLARYVSFALPDHRISVLYRTRLKAEVPSELTEGIIKIADWARETEVFSLSNAIESFPNKKQKYILEALRELEELGFIESIKASPL